MKKIVLMAMIALASNVSQAHVQLFCTSLGELEDGNDINRHVLIREVVEMNCSTLKFSKDTNSGLERAESYSVKFEGVGIGLRGTTFVELATLTCPTVRPKALGVDEFMNRRGRVKKGIKDFYGLKVTAAAFFAGGDIGVFGNKKMGACALTGVQFLGLGAGISGARMTIEKLN